MKPKSAFYLLLTLSISNIVLTVCSFMELNKKEMVISDPTISLPNLDRLVEETRIRDSITLQFLLLGQHKQGLHGNDTIELCPICQAELKLTKL